MSTLITRKMWIGALIGTTSAMSLTTQAGVGDGHLAMWSFNGETNPLVITDKSGKGNNGTPTEVSIWPDMYGGDYYDSWWNQKEQ